MAVCLVQNNKTQLIATTQEETISHGNSRFPKKMILLPLYPFFYSKKTKKQNPLLFRGILRIDYF
ncbi:hypothetical protein B4168_2133 [Anoxybacillus flavithermus]|nr:hypothetical protein B4168_2133 [Anoxybacillus flavithermus]OAO85789.1 hypothetical protein GT23_2692 [Parageobacillus thermoglucosidasius]